MRDPKRRAKSMAILWLRKCYNLGITASEVVAESAVTTSAVTTASRKEKGKGKENIPPAPPIEKRERQEKATTTTTARARAWERGTFPPTIEMIYAECDSEKIPRLYGDYFLDCQVKERWRHPRTLKFLHGWRKALRVWWNNEGTFPGRSTWEEYQSDHTTEERSERRYDIFGEGE